MIKESSKKPRSFLTGLMGFFLGIFVCLGWQSCFSNIPRIALSWVFPSARLAPFSGSRMPKLPNFPFSDFESEMDSDSGLGLGMDSATEAPGAVKQREDDQYVYLDVSIKGLDGHSLNVEVVDGQVNLKGQIHNENNHGGVLVESFNRSFPAPENTDTKKVEIDNSPETLTLKFPKKIVN